MSQHAAVTVPARDRRRLERLDDGRLVYCLKHRWRDGMTAFVFEPAEFVARLAAMVPPPLAPPRRAAARCSIPPGLV